MLSIEKCREILGTREDGVVVDDEFIRKLLSELYSLSEVLVGKAISDLSTRSTRGGDEDKSE